MSVTLALLAVAFMVAMVLTGSLPETRQLAKFEAKGVLKVPPEHVRRVELRVGEHTATFVRTPDKEWAQSGRQDVLTGELLEDLTEVSGPWAWLLPKPSCRITGDRAPLIDACRTPWP